MTFLENIFERLQRASGAIVVSEIHDGEVRPVTGGELLSMVQQARQFLRARGLKKGDRCALLASNSIRWIALDLALMAEGIVVVPLYSRQAPSELVHMLLDALPLRIFCMNAAVAAELKRLWPGAPHISLLESAVHPMKPPNQLRRFIMKTPTWLRSFTLPELLVKRRA